MYLENLVFDAVDPSRMGRFWEAMVGGERLTDEPDGFETRLTVVDGPVIDLCFQRVAAPPEDALRLHLDLARRPHPAAEIDQIVDPEGNPFHVLGDDAGDADTGPLAAIRLDCTDPSASAEFWSWLTGWTDVTGGTFRTMRHPSRRGPRLELRPEPVRKGDAKNRRHLDIRLEATDAPDAVAAGIVERGGRELHPEWGDLPWRHYADPSGNEFCVLPARP